MSKIRIKNLDNNGFKNRSELLIVVMIILIIFGLNLLTIERLPIVSIDEVCYSDPGINLYLGNGFHSTAWYSQDDSQIFASNAPLYSLVLSQWLHLTGFSMPGVRSLNLFFAALGIFLAWLGVRRSGVVTRPEFRIFFVILISTGTGMVFAFRFGRYDTLMLLLFCVLILANSISNMKYRLFSLFLLALLFPLAGLQMIPLVAIFGLLLIIFVGRSYLAPVGAVWFGVGVGTAVYYAALLFMGLLPIMRTAAAPHASFRLRVPELCPSWAIALFGLAMVAVWKAQTRQENFRSFVVFGIVAGLVIPFGLAAVGKFPRAYFWMAYLPVTAAWMAELDRHVWRKAGVGTRTVCGVLVGCAILVGLPAYLVIVGLEWKGRSYDSVEALVERNVNRSDSVFCDWSAYYPAKKISKSVVLPTYGVGWKAMNDFGLHGGARIPKEARAEISVLIVRPENVEAVIAMLGGNWSNTGDHIGGGANKTLSLPFGRRLGSVKYSLDVYRRAPLHARPSPAGSDGRTATGGLS